MPTVRRVWVEKVLDEIPDLSWLETKMEDGKIVSSARYTNDDIKKYGLAKVKEWVERDQQRLADYGRTWWMVGIIAKAEILIPKKTVPPTYQIQKLQSGGLWGIESDSDKSYFKEFADDELADLSENLKGFSLLTPESKKLVKNAELVERD
jgi:hypothetical protein